MIAFTSAIVSTVIGTFTAYALYKFNFRGKKAFQSLLNLPIITPDIVIGIGLLLFYVMINFTLGYYSVLFAHITFNIAYTTLIVSTRFHYIDVNLENAAIDLGAKPFLAFRYAIVPAIMPGIIAAILIAFTLSWDDFIVSFFTSGVGTTTLPVRVYSMIKMGVNPQINAISTITLIVSLILIIIALKLQKSKIAT
ncbi:ABC transporter permease [Ferruginibacter sp. SUN106]|uniref:ABC transporter permease n=1 Tax=Ferruginibacter sp. SUN106 TaxID=2978348 RepID=UPI003D36F79E